MRNTFAVGECRRLYFIEQFYGLPSLVRLYGPPGFGAFTVLSCLLNRDEALSPSLLIHDARIVRPCMSVRS